MSSTVRCCGAHSGHSASFSPSDFMLNEWPHRKCTAGSSSGAPLSAHLLAWYTRAWWAGTGRAGRGMAAGCVSGVTAPGCA